MMRNILEGQSLQLLIKLFKPMEIIIIDDGSYNDDAEKIVNKFSITF